MIKLKDVEILDLLPYTFKRNPRYIALSKAIKTMFDVLYNQNSRSNFWADINNAYPEILDAMAAELDAPFYFTSMPDDQKRTIITAAFAYNSQIGTVGAVQSILNAAFGGGEIVEWVDYNGKPYHFKLNITIDHTKQYLSKEIVENFYKLLDKVKNVRSKLDALTIETSAMGALYIGGIIQKHKVITLPVTNAIHQYAVEGTLNMGGAVQKCKVITLKEN